jgi:hypothetical protein
MVPLGNPEDLDRQEKEATEALLRALGGVDAGGGGGGDLGGRFFVSDKEVEDDYLALLAEAGLEDDKEDGGLELDDEDEEGNLEIHLFNDVLPPTKRPRKNQGPPPPAYASVIKTVSVSSQAEIKRLQSQALAAKRNGNIPLAKQLVMQYKALQAAPLLPSFAESKNKPAPTATLASVATLKTSDTASSTAESIESRMQTLKKEIATAKANGDFDTARALFQKLKTLKLCLKTGSPAPPPSVAANTAGSASAHPLSKTPAIADGPNQTKTTLAKRRTLNGTGKPKDKQTILSGLQRDIMAVRKRQSDAMQRGDADAAGSLYEDFLELNAQYKTALGMKSGARLPTKKQPPAPTKKPSAVDGEEEPRGGKGDDNDLDVDNIQLSDGDEEDPDIMAALGAIVAAEGDGEEDAEGATEENEVVVAAVAAAAAANGLGKTQEMRFDERIASIEEDIQNLKVSAVMAKRDGDLIKARRILAQFKQRKMDKNALLKEINRGVGGDGKNNDLADATITTKSAMKSSNAPEAHTSSIMPQKVKDSIALEIEINTATETVGDVTLVQELAEIKSQIDQTEAKLIDLKKRYGEAELFGDASSAKLLMTKCKECVSEKKELLVIYDEIAAEIGTPKEDAPDKMIAVNVQSLDKLKLTPAPSALAAPATPTSAINPILTATAKTETTTLGSHKIQALLTPAEEQSSREHLTAIIKELQKKALAAKKAGDLNQCKRHFSAYKALQKKLQDLPSEPLAGGSSTVESSITPASTKVSSSSSSAAAELDSPKHASRLTQLEVSAQQARTRALEYKKKGDLAAAKQELAQYKLLKSQINAMLVKGGKDVPADAQKEAKRLNAARNRAVDRLDNVVTSELALIHRIMKLAQASDDKDLVAQLTKALPRAHLQRKSLAQFRPGGSSATRPVPKLSTRTVVDRLKVRNLDVAANELRLIIHSINDVPYRGDPERAINAFVKFDFGYPRTAPIEGQTPVVAGKGRLVSFDKSFSLGIGSGRLSSKATLRHFEKRRMNFSIWHRKSGIFSSEDFCFGKACADLAPLLERAVVKEIEVPLFQESRRRPSGGHLRVTMKLRQPLQGDDIRSIQRQMLVLDLLN